MTQQLALFEDIVTQRKEAIRRQKKVNQILDRMAKLHEELNSAMAYRSEAPMIHSPEDVADLVQYDMACLQQEELRVVLLNTRNHVIKIATVYRGSLNSSQVRIGEVFRAAIIECAAAVIVIHNHPSGDPTPSPDDVAITRAIVQAGKLLDIECLDHLIVGAGRFVSLKERGLGF
jgi:DNA repair protein RadC